MNKLTDAPYRVLDALRDHLPFVPPSAEQEMYARQRHLHEYTGHLAIVGAYSIGEPGVDWEKAEAIASRLSDNNIIRNTGKVGVRAILPVTGRHHKQYKDAFTNDVRLLGEAAYAECQADARIYPDDPLHTFLGTDKKLDIAYTVLDSGLYNYEKDTESIDDDPSYNPKSFVAIMRPFDVLKIFPGMNHRHLKNGGAVVLEKVGSGQTDNVWSPIGNN